MPAKAMAHPRAMAFANFIGLNFAHQVRVYLLRRSAAFMNRPHNQTLTTAHISGGENTRDTGQIMALVGAHIAALIAYNAHLLQ
jgi:hypothetical protein